MLRQYTTAIAMLAASTLIAQADPLTFDGVYAHSDEERGDEICACIKSQQRDCLYGDNDGSDGSATFERILVFAGDSTFSPVFEAGCSVEVVGEGTLSDASVEHFMGMCISPGGTASFSGYRMSTDDEGIVAMNLTGPAYLVRPVRATPIEPDFDNGTYNTLLMPVECDDVSIEEAKTYFQADM